MKKILVQFISIVSLIILVGCAPAAYRTSGGGLGVQVDPWGDTSISSIRAEANRACRELGRGTAQNLREVKRSDGISYAHWAFDCTSGSGSSGYTVSNSYSNSYSDSSPKLFYDSSTGGMKECSYVPTNGKCNSFKIYNSRAYNKNTLFYDSSTDSMRPCLGTVTMTGRCTMFGLYKSSLSSKNQLFYDSDNNRMTTCRHVSVTGKCLAKDLIPRSGSTGGTYIVDDPSNPYYKKVPRSSQDLIRLGNDMIMGNCTLGLNC